MSDEARANAIAAIEQTLRNAGLLDNGFAGEVQMLEWSKSTSRDGPKIKLLLPEDDSMLPFELATIRKGKQAGQLYYLFAIRIDEHLATPPLSEIRGILLAPDDVKPYGKEASELYRLGFFLNPNVLETIGTDEEFRVWLIHLRCAVEASVGLSVDVGRCEGDVVAAHVRRVALGAGGAIKPPYSAIPLCHHHHTLQHQQGESALGGKEWFDKQRAKYVTEWASHRLAQHLGAESMGHVPPDTLRAWGAIHDLTNALPRVYREGGNDESTC